MHHSAPSSAPSSRLEGVVALAGGLRGLVPLESQDLLASRGLRGLGVEGCWGGLGRGVLLVVRRAGQESLGSWGALAALGAHQGLPRLWGSVEGRPDQARALSAEPGALWALRAAKETLAQLDPELLPQVKHSSLLHYVTKAIRCHEQS